MQFRLQPMKAVPILWFQKIQRAYHGIGITIILKNSDPIWLPITKTTMEWTTKATVYVYQLEAEFDTSYLLELVVEEGDYLKDQ